MPKIIKMSSKQQKPIRVEGISTDGEAPKQNWQYSIQHFTPLGRELKISPKALLSVNAPGYKKEIFVESVQLMIGIGNDHTADLIMPKDSWEAFIAGEKLSITTSKDLIQKHGFPADKIK
jgi:hypothetical protein